jgi:selenide,water dikinase
MGPETLAQVLRPLTATFSALDRPELLVGLGAADDAAVYQISAEQAVVATVDFFPPVVDDPATYGAIAVTNALSDIYAMGGTPLLALNIVAFPDDLDPAILTEILRGGAEQARRAGVIIAGGHTVTDAEPKYGLAVIGTVHPQRIITKGGARPGDAIILTKAIGTGIITTALKRDAINETSDAYHAAVASMTTLNDAALRVARAMETRAMETRAMETRAIEIAPRGVPPRSPPAWTGVHAGTDITGFGLLGHLWEMLSVGETRLGARIVAGAVPLLAGTRDLATAGNVPGGTERNLAASAPHVRWGAAITDVDRALLADPQTAGGLALAVAPEDAPPLLAAFTQANVTAWQVAIVTDTGYLDIE